MAKAAGVSRSTVQRIWDAHGLQPHRITTFKLSKDPAFVEKLTDVVGLYLNPPDKAVVLCVDEKSQIQALDRTQPGLPMKPGRRGTMTHDYKRHGTTTLFAALNVLTGEVIGQCHGRHRHQEFLKFLRHLDRAFPPDLTLHVILDNYATHKHKKVRKWLAARPRFKLHFTPTSASWLNLVESWFSKLTQQRLRRGVFCSVQELVAAIQDYLTQHNADPKPFVWSTTVEAILDKVNKCKVILAARGKRPRCIRAAMHPGWRRCSSVEYGQYARSSRLASRAPGRSRCNAGFSPRAARDTPLAQGTAWMSTRKF